MKFFKKTRGALRSLARKLLGCVIIKCSNVHFGISESAFAWNVAGWSFFCLTWVITKEWYNGFCIVPV